jgi:hypothetical protein
MAWLLPLALLLSTWWMFRLNPCLDNETGNRFHEWFPPTRMGMASAPASPDAVVIDNPYGIETCDYWPTMSDHWVTLLTLLFITALVGFLAAGFAQRPVRRAMWMMLAGMAPIVAFSQVVYLPGFLKYAADEGYAAATLEVGVGVLLMLIAASLSAFSAWLRVRQLR